MSRPLANFLIRVDLTSFSSQKFSPKSNVFRQLFDTQTIWRTFQITFFPDENRTIHYPDSAKELLLRSFSFNMAFRQTTIWRCFLIILLSSFCFSIDKHFPPFLSLPTELSSFTKNNRVGFSCFDSFPVSETEIVWKQRWDSWDDFGWDQFVLEIESGIRFENRLKRLKIEMKRVNCEKDEFEEKVKRMTYEYEKINEFWCISWKYNIPCGDFSRLWLYCKILIDIVSSLYLRLFR